MLVEPAELEEPTIEVEQAASPRRATSRMAKANNGFFIF
jgi:hypothetical protein